MIKRQPLSSRRPPRHAALRSGTRLLFAFLCLGLALAPQATPQARGATGHKIKSSSKGDHAGAKTADFSRKQIALLSTEQDLSPILKQFGLTQVGGSIRKSVYKLQTPPGTTQAQVAAMATAIGQFPGVIFAEPDRLATSIEVGGCLIDDTGALGQAGVQQCTVGFVDGTPTLGEFKDQFALAQIDAEATQRLPHPFTPVVAVIDTGIDPGHPVLAGNLYTAGFDFVEKHKRGFDHPDGVDNDGDGLVDEAYGHGTHIAGSVMAVDPWARILPIRCLNSDGNGSGFDIAAGIFYAVDAGADVINLSLSFEIPSLSVVSALQYAEAMDVVVITSAGNTGGEVLFPGNYDPADYSWTLPLLGQVTLDGHNLVTVAAVDELDGKAGFSAYGDSVDLSAPGVDIYSAMPGGGFAWWSGTSMAAALVSGAAALTIGIGGPVPFTSPPDLLIDHTDPIDRHNPGLEGDLGTGRINALSSGLDALSP